MKRKRKMWKIIYLILHFVTLFGEISPQGNVGTCYCVPQGTCNNNNNNNNNNFNNNNNNGNNFNNNNGNNFNNNNGNNFPNNGNNFNGNNGNNNNGNNFNNNNNGNNFNNNNNGNNNFNNNNGGNYDINGDGSPDIRMRIQAANTNNGGSSSNFLGSQQQLTSPVMLQTFVSNQQCQNGLQQCCSNGGYQCGMRFPSPNNARQPTLPGQSSYGAHPWLAVIVRQVDNNFQGTGALIDHQHVLTAAHKLNATIYERQQLRVLLGVWDSQNEIYQPSSHSVLTTLVHPQFNPSNLRNDVALLRLSPNANLGAVPTIATVCLPQSAVQSPIRCWVAGYGSSTMNGPYQQAQKEINLPLVDSQTCQNLLRQTRLGPNFFLDTSSFMCAGGEQGSDACTGDGGAPLVCYIANQWYVLGLVAWGINCGTNTPGVYVNVAGFTNWIQQTVRSN